MSNSTIAKCQITYKGDQPSELEEIISDIGGINTVVVYEGDATFELQDCTISEMESSLEKVKDFLSECEGISSFRISSCVYEFIDEGYHFDSEENPKLTEN